MSLATGTPLPSLEGVTEWLNEEANLNDYQGRPILVQFWAISCPACKANLPLVQQMMTEHCDRGLCLISVHMPRIPADTDVESVKVSVKKLRLTGPCAIDNQHILGDRFQTGGIWPTYFLFDTDGKLRSRGGGLLGIKTANNSLKRLLQSENAL